MSTPVKVSESIAQHTGEIGTRVRLADELEKIESLIQRHVELSCPELAMLLAAWIVNTYTFEFFDYCGYLHIQSATPMCGKTILLKVLRYLSKGKPPILTAPTAAGLFRSPHKILLIDEAEKLRDHDRENFGTLMAVLNAGIEKDGQVSRLIKNTRGDYDAQYFPVYGPKALAGIEDIADTLESRSFHIRMQRSTRGRRRLRGRTFDQEAQPIRDRLEEWAGANEAPLRVLYDKLVTSPDSLGPLKGFDERFQDLAEPLVLLVTVADEERPEGPPLLPRFLAGLEAAWARRTPLGRECQIKAFLKLARTRLGDTDHVFISSQELLNEFQGVPALAEIHSFNKLADLLKPFDLAPRSNGRERGYDITHNWVDEWSTRYNHKEGQVGLTPLTAARGVSTGDYRGVLLPPDSSMPEQSGIPPVKVSEVSVIDQHKGVDEL